MPTSKAPHAFFTRGNLHTSTLSPNIVEMTQIFRRSVRGSCTIGKSVSLSAHLRGLHNLASLEAEPQHEGIHDVLRCAHVVEKQGVHVDEALLRLIYNEPMVKPSSGERESMTTGNGYTEMV